MKKLFSALFCMVSSQQVFADPTESAPIIVNKNDTYISAQAYTQNPFVGIPSAGGTQFVTESELAHQNAAEKLFADGTWNTWITSSIATNNGYNPAGEYGATLFGQTGQLAGFSFGGAFNVINPFLTPDWNPTVGTPAANQYLTSARQITPLEAYVEYQYSNVVQVDIGWIGINNSPWLGSNFYSNQSSGLNYQGAIVNVDPGGGWLLTALGFNAAQATGQAGFDGSTLYNTNFNWGSGTPYLFSDPSAGTVAIGANYMGFDNSYNLRLWAYSFNNYANLVYADNSIKFSPNPQLSFTLAAQGGMEWGETNNALTNNGYGNVQSNFVGAQAGLSYEWFGLTLGYNNVWGPQTAFGNGAIVSPYTYNVNWDPLYSTAWMQGLVGKASAGQAYKIAPSFTFLDGNLSISPTYAYSNTSAALADSELDWVVSYSVPQVKGLNLFGVYAYEWQPTVGYDQQTQQPLQGAGSYTAQFMVSYLY